MLIRFILLSFYFLGRGQLDKTASSAVLLRSFRAYQWNLWRLAGTVCINANNNFIGVSFFLFVPVQVSVALLLPPAWTQRQEGRREAWEMLLFLSVQWPRFPLTAQSPSLATFPGCLYLGCLAAPKWLLSPPLLCQDPISKVPALSWCW